MRSTLLAGVLFSSLMGCGVDSTEPSQPPTKLTSAETEPSGGHCAAGGIAVHTGIDDNANGTLDASEVDSTTYTCAHRTLLREDAIGSGSVCPGGGVLVRSGRDLDDSGALEDAEIENTVTICHSDEIFRGDLETSDFATPQSRERLAHVRIVTGNVAFDSDAAMPALEMVGGSVDLRVGSLVELPALNRIAGNLMGPPPLLLNNQPAPRSVQFKAPALVNIGGNASLTSWIDGGSFSAPALGKVEGRFELGGKLSTIDLTSLARVGSELRIDVPQVTELNLPALKGAGGTIRVGGWFKSLDLHSLESAAGFELVYSSIPSLSLPALKTAGSILLRRSPVTSIEMPLVAGVSSLAIDGLHDLTVFDAPLVTNVDKLYVARMLTADLSLFASVQATSLTIEKNAFVDLGGLEQMTSATSVTIQNNGKLATLEGLEHLATITGDLVIKNNPELKSLAALAGLTNVGGQITIADNPALRAADVAAFLHRLGR